MSIILLFTALSSCLRVVADAPAASAASEQSEAEVLRAYLDQLSARAKWPVVSYFAIGGVGFGGEPSAGELILRDVLHSSNPAAVLEAWWQRGNPVERAYALVGFYHIAPQRYLQAKERLQKDDAVIAEMIGCSRAETSYAEIIKSLEAGYYTKRLLPYLQKPSSTHEDEVYSFCLGGVTPLRLTPGEIRLRKVLVSDFPANALEGWYASARYPAGRAYALLGLYYIAPERYRELKQTLNPKGEWFTRSRGLEREACNLVRLSAAMETGEFDAWFESTGTQK